MLLIYNIGLQLYFYIAFIAALFNKKARLWVNGRKNTDYINYEQSIWFHFASLGEFEQGRPLLEHFRKKYPQKKIVITFFSPSGYEVRKNTPLADAVYYLPLDTAANARRFISAINPEIAIFTKYEYWYHFFNELYKRDVPLYVISAIFRPGQVFFKWYGSLHRKMLGFVKIFFVQDEQSIQLLQSIGINSATISGDTRFDRVWANAQGQKELPLIAEFTGSHKVFIAGSTWPEDEALLATLVNDYADWKFIFAPHETGEEKINKLISLLPFNSTIKYSQLTTHHSPYRQSLIIDNIGMLSSLYQYADLAYIGGGFGAGIHNTLEAAAFGLPVIFGPNYDKFKEARELIALQGGFSINNEAELKSTAAYVLADIERYKAICERIKNYVEANTGATAIIMERITI
jgi:3-deoxy-D-manno-octulosonic-acid transferase